MDELAAVEASRLNAERARAEGKVEGIVEGEAKGKLEAARNALIEEIEPTIVSKITGLPLEIVEKLKSELLN